MVNRYAAATWDQHYGSSTNGQLFAFSVLRNISYQEQLDTALHSFSNVSCPTFSTLLTPHMFGCKAHGAIFIFQWLGWSASLHHTWSSNSLLYICGSSTTVIAPLVWCERLQVTHHIVGRYYARWIPKIIFLTR